MGTGTPRVEGFEDDALVARVPAVDVPFDADVGLVWELFSPDRVVCHLDVEQRHRQPTGAVHGGVYATLVEAAGSSASMARVIGDGRVAVGVHNATSFHRPTTGGRLTAVATPVHVGRTQHLWRVEITRDDGRLAASGELRTAVVDPPPGFWEEVAAG